MSEHGLSARGIFHHRESIDVYLIIGLNALAVTGFMEARTGWRSRGLSTRRGITAPSRSAPASASSPPKSRSPPTYGTRPHRSPKQVRTHMVVRLVNER